MKYSKQRELILKVLSENVVHPTADFVYEIIKKEMPNISLATVYRNLNQLTANGMIKKAEGLDGSVHFDYNTHPHYHFICNRCNKIYDIPYDIAPALGEKVFARTGMSVENYDLCFKGICSDCQNKNIT